MLHRVVVICPAVTEERTASLFRVSEYTSILGAFPLLLSLYFSLDTIKSLCRWRQDVFSYTSEENLLNSIRCLQNAVSNRIRSRRWGSLLLLQIGTRPIDFGLWTR